MTAIGDYEELARDLQDAFDILRAEAARPDAAGFSVPDIARDREFCAATNGLPARFAAAYQALGEIGLGKIAPQSLLSANFQAFAEPMDPKTAALALCEHHEAVQRAKSESGKRPWFDRLGAERIFIRHSYRIPRPDRAAGTYVHAYRGWPIRRFHSDLT